MIADIVPMEQWWHLEHSIQLAKATLSPDWTKNIRDELTHKDAQYYVALENGGVKGFAGWKKSGVHPEIYEFPWCVVHPDYRRQGIGRAFVERRIADVRGLGGKAIILTTPSPEVYIKYDFHTRAVIPNSWANHFMMKTL